jgi:hypothetical protein
MKESSWQHQLYPMMTIMVVPVVEVAAVDLGMIHQVQPAQVLTQEALVIKEEPNE